VTSDVQAVRAFVDGVIIQLVILVLSLVCYLIYMLRIDLGVTLACLATTPILWLLTVIFSRLVRPAYDRTRELVDHVVLTLAENIQGVHVVKGFGREGEEIAKFRTALQAVEDVELFILRDSEVCRAGGLATGDEARERKGANGEQAMARVHLLGATKWGDRRSSFLVPVRYLLTRERAMNRKNRDKPGRTR
jgi:ABC-type multidrug transport system fused ATPase/permease subunit